ncbi:uncharacterized protein LOC124451486 [Xenia sp. Carnegie-2017]|uniref:uncharacterized protein LOC124451486 n=1 Tax=Xenia sp. Carnegie-2017 TaxID=2897299 RepID=UPI001F034118|nr:uncharacterized protein LOC124451486 [Xenia sp. Carnegie-2017]
MLGEGISEVDETSTMEVTSAVEQNFNMSSVFNECLKENIDWKENDKQVESKQLTTKFKFNNLTIAEENHTDLVDYSMENDSHDQSLNSIFRSDSDDLNDFNDKESTSFELFSKQANEKNNVNRKKEDVESKESTQLLSINDSDKAKNNPSQPNKGKNSSIFNSLFSSKSRSMLPKKLRKTNSSPNLKTSGSRKWLLNKENISRIADNDELSSFSSEEYHETSSCFSSSGNVTQTNLKSESLQEPERMDSSEFFDQVNSNDKVVNNSDDDCLVNEVFAKCNDVPVVSVCGDNSLPDRHGEQLIKMFEENQRSVNCNVSSKTSAPDFGNYDGGLVEDKKGWKKLERNLQDHGLLEENSADSKDNRLVKSTQTVIDIKENDLSLKERQIEDDMISRAEFAINDTVNLSSMINIPSTELINDHSFEPYKRKYTVYLIKYNLHLWEVNDDEKDEELGGVNQIKRRYREFMELHHRLVCGALSDYMKDIPKPNRKFNSPFFRLDEDVIKGRQFLLENYLKCLVNKPAILNSEDFKGFLGIGEKNKTDFRRPLVVVPTLPQVPRIDKKLKENMSKFLDHIKTAFDSGPVDGEEDYDYEGLMFGDDKTTQDDVRSFVFCSTDSQVNHSCFQSFLRHKMTDEHEAQVSYSANFKLNGLEKDLSRMKEAEKSQMSKNVQPLDSYKTGLCKDEGASNPLTKTVLNLSCHFLEKRHNWVCLEPVQEAATAVFGCFIEWWMEGFLSDLVSEEQWQYYLKLLTDSVWPGDRLVKIKKDQKNVEEILKNGEKAVRTLINVLTGIFHSTIGAEIIEECAKEIVDSFQYPEINRQLLLEMFEVILIEVFPEFPEDKKDYLRNL